MKGATQYTVSQTNVYTFCKCDVKIYEHILRKNNITNTCYFVTSKMLVTLKCPPPGAKHTYCVTNIWEEHVSFSPFIMHLQKKVGWEEGSGKNLNWALSGIWMMKKGRKEKAYRRGSKMGREQTQCTRVLKIEINVALTAWLLCVRYYVKYFICILFHLITTQHEYYPYFTDENLKQVLRASNPVRKLEKVSKDSSRWYS